MRPSRRALWIPTLLVLLATAPGARADRASRLQRPGVESCSDGPTLLWKHKVSTAGPNGAPQLYRQSKLRLKALQWGESATITVNDDLKNYLTGANGTTGLSTGALEQLRQRVAASGARPAALQAPGKRLFSVALSSRERLSGLLSRQGIEGQQRNLLAEMMVWRNLAYHSATLAHGSFGPDDPGDGALQEKARDGLDAAVAASFTLGRRISQGGQGQLRWQDITHLQGTAIKDFPEKEPGQVRNVNFTWPVNSFGVHHPTLHGADGQVARFTKFLEAGGGERSKALGKNPLGFMARTLYWVHNIHPFRDGNGRTEVLLGWSLARAAGYPLPLDYDQSSGAFKLAATKWGGTRSDLRGFLAQGALGTERFARKLLPLLRGGKIVSSHTDHGAVGMVTSSTAGQRNLLVMFPVTHARQMDKELQAEQGKNRVVLTGSTFDPASVRIEIAIDGKHNRWQTVTPAAINRWNRRYPWWTTVEPIYKVALPAGASYVNFRVIGADGQKVGAEDYYLNLRGYQNINSRIGGGQ